MNAEQHDIVVVGAGVVGICAAAYLAEAGRKVTVVDRSGICEETSSGNAAALAFSDILPLAHKGMLRQVPKWLVDPLGPLSIPPAYLPALSPWLLRFWRAGRSGGEAATAAQAGLMKLAEAEWMALIQRADAKDMLREDGSLELYESEAEFRVSLPGWNAREQYGIEFRHLGKEELPEYQPGLSERFSHGTFAPGWKTVGDPQIFSRAIWRHAETKGAIFQKVAVVGADRDGDGPKIRLSDGGLVVCRTLVVAAGAWSHLLAKDFGDHIPLETERGYNTTLPVGAFDIRRQLIFSGHGFVVTPLDHGIRVGGAVELGGLKRPPNFARSKAMLRKAQSFLPGLNTEGGREWMGFRPSLPDSLPVIGRSRAVGNVIYAFGHGHLGLTQAAATGRLISQLVSGEKPTVDLLPFSPQRF